MTTNPSVPLVSQENLAPQPTVPTPPNKKTWIILAIAVILVLYGVIANAAIRKLGSPRPTLPAPTATPTPTPTPRAIRQGKEIYTISSSSHVGPSIWQATIDPHDPKVGERQTMTVSVRSKLPIESVIVNLKSDNTTTIYPLTLLSGSPTDGVWQGSWDIADTVLYAYVATVHASDGKNTSSVDITMR
jgi:hypothetical protein